MSEITGTNFALLFSHNSRGLAQRKAQGGAAMHIQKKRLSSMDDTAWDTVDDNISQALMHRLKARIARRESRLKQITFELSPRDAEPNLLPAA